MTLVPTIDLSTWDDGDRAKPASAVDDALTHVGFLQVTGHGIPQATLDAMREATAAFFALPVEEKLRSAPADRASDRGYAAEGTEGPSTRPKRIASRRCSWRSSRRPGKTTAAVESYTEAVR
ncbi:2-oxoglutarate and iron-dependent oxygenase domain-containing protein [Amycolatopsis sp. NPDC051071]|uniref:2-oxoglutarate and iron-dependent oxygenase domain-containing protein n=1 Tax=Amycolatopsis sp. NPDC051071 TaxID=3154637 RepID=UPI003415E297